MLVQLKVTAIHAVVLSEKLCKVSFLSLLETTCQNTASLLPVLFSVLLMKQS